MFRFTPRVGNGIRTRIHIAEVNSRPASLSPPPQDLVIVCGQRSPCREIQRSYRVTGDSKVKNPRAV